MSLRPASLTPLSSPGGSSSSGDSKLYTGIADPYQGEGKYHDATSCPLCGAVFAQGRWSWIDAPRGALRDACPACVRTRDRVPAGFVTLKGSIVDGKRDDFIRVARAVEETVKAQAPLARIIAIEPQPGRIFVTTTDLDLARRIGDAVRAAHGGTLEVKVADDRYAVRVLWYR